MQKESLFESDVKSNKVKEGFLFLRSRVVKEWKKRWIVLTKNCIYSFEHQGVYNRPS